jgi:hypothetical protein
MAFQSSCNSIFWYFGGEVPLVFTEDVGSSGNPSEF